MSAPGGPKENALENEILTLAIKYKYVKFESFIGVDDTPIVSAKDAIPEGINIVPSTAMTEQVYLERMERKSSRPKGSWRNRWHACHLCLG